MNKIVNKYNDAPSLYKIVKCCTLEDVEFIRHTDFQRHKNNQNGFGWTLLHHASQEGNNKWKVYGVNTSRKRDNNMGKTGYFHADD